MVTLKGRAVNHAMFVWIMLSFACVATTCTSDWSIVELWDSGYTHSMLKSTNTTSMSYVCVGCMIHSMLK